MLSSWVTGSCGYRAVWFNARREYFISLNSYMNMKPKINDFQGSFINRTNSWLTITKLYKWEYLN